MSTLTKDQLLDQLKWRYATKQFDSTKKIPADVWNALEASLVLTPSSCGLQPWKFIVITDPVLKEKLKAHSWGQSQVVDCSHFVVFASLTELSEAYVDKFLQRTVQVRGGSMDALKGYRDMIVGTLIHGPRSHDIKEWAARQTYIALGNFMTSAAVLGIDTCPMEGIEPAKYDEILGLAPLGLTTVVACPAGYRATGDKYASLAKVRFPEEDVILHR